jgi:hypothetical protein
MMTFLIVVRALLIVVFAVAAVSKLRSGDEFRDFVSSLKGMDYVRSASLPLAVLIVSFELLSVACLAIRQAVRVGFVFSTVTLLILTVGVAAAVRSGRQVECRCFGADGGILARRHLARNSFLLIASLVGLAGTLAAPHHEMLLRRDGLAAAASGALFGVLLTRWDDLTFLLFGEIQRETHSSIGG